MADLVHARKTHGLSPRRQETDRGPTKLGSIRYVLYIPPCRVLLLATEPFQRTWSSSPQSSVSLFHPQSPQTPHHLHISASMPMYLAVSSSCGARTCYS